MNHDLISKIHTSRGQSPLPIRTGQTLMIHERLGGEGGRLWRFKGLVIKVKRPNESTGTFTIRGQVAGHTVEKVYPLAYARFEKVIKLDEFKKRSSKLYYLRDKIGKDARMKSILTKEERDEVLYDKAEQDAKFAAIQAEQDAKVVAEAEKKEEAKAEATAEATDTAEEKSAEEADTNA